ncbi:Bifunctional enzyme CysN/CysC [Ferriphaselus amnicola]|jgi:bifunctional enzyme CysN/CysC|uniref:Multifunctional fusion protein n=1 Tax=Ferriphaselus amnicola TaxID=1188319 RepID=A0A2Z6GEN1_9PROT|nr:sulfate adenylyltransferase subunit CysN [Ferriphaselus amnicola]BBE51880.1 Bifunctional enzyme CysN/CysC [Ferriphaselus amnicola]
MSKIAKTTSATRAADARTAVEAYLVEQEQLGLLRFITCGSVDDGKSTLIGRMLWEAKQIYDDQVASLKSDSKKHGTQGEDIDFALLVDGLAAEREQGITIDVAYRFFATDKRKFIVADTPGHEQYTRNMVTGASTADVAILLIDARYGVQVQTRRHAYLVSLMGIRHVVLAINKMDLVNFDQQVYQNIEADFREFAQTLGFESITPIPLSALKGDNMLSRSEKSPWYTGPTLMGYLETVDVSRPAKHDLVFPVQWVNRPNLDFRGFTGTITEGTVKVGDTVRVTATGQTAEVERIVTFHGDLPEARAGQAITLTLNREIDASRGDVFSHAQNPLDTTDQFEATIVWMGEEPGLSGRTYDLRLATQWTSASITAIDYKIDVNTLKHESHKQLELNDICVCKLSTSKPLAFDSFANSNSLGSFILVDRFTHATIAAGTIRHTLRRAQNIHRHSHTITRVERERLNGHQGKVFWLTGYSGSGKSTIANSFESAIHAEGYRTYTLDGDNIRHGLNKDLGFTDADRVENIRRVAEVAKLMVDAGLVVITAFISPFRSERDFARSLFEEGQFVEVFVDTPLDVCESRDPKGLYKKARAGQIPNMTGINSAYEAPLHAEIRIDTTQATPSESVSLMKAKLTQ